MYSNYIGCEKISQRLYTDIEKLTFVMETIDNDNRFERRLNVYMIQKNIHGGHIKVQSSATFPHTLSLEIVP